MKYKKAITALALAALLLAGCAAPQAVQAPAPQQTAKAAETQSGVTFTDDMGYPVTAVSYTHLDVYKRQVITSAIIIAFLLRMAFPKLQKVTCRRVSQILHTE